MKHFDILGKTPRGRRGVSSTRTVTADDPDGMADAINNLQRQIADAQGKAPPDAVEYEANLVAGTPISLAHGFGCPTRFYTTHWKVSDDTGQATSGTVAALPNPLTMTNAQILAQDIVTATDAANAGLPGSLNGLSVALHNLGQDPGVATGCSCEGAVSSSAVFKAPRGSYNVVFTIAGTMELKAYTGGSNDGAYYQIGGAPTATTTNRYEIIVSSPAAIFYVNRTGAAEPSPPFSNTVVSYSKTIQIDAGATVTLTADSSNGFMNKEGQFFSITITSMTKV